MFERSYNSLMDSSLNQRETTAGSPTFRSEQSALPMISA